MLLTLHTQRHSNDSSRSREIAVQLSTKQRGNPQNNFGEVGIFFALGNGRQSDHVYHAIHHNFTTKTPPLPTTFPKTTLKKHQQARNFWAIGTGEFF
jgi:hypothetical protein